MDLASILEMEFGSGHGMAWKGRKYGGMDGRMDGKMNGYQSMNEMHWIRMIAR